MDKSPLAMQAFVALEKQIKAIIKQAKIKNKTTKEKFWFAEFFVLDNYVMPDVLDNKSPKTTDLLKPITSFVFQEAKGKFRSIEKHFKVWMGLFDENYKGPNDEKVKDLLIKYLIAHKRGIPLRKKRKLYYFNILIMKLTLGYINILSVNYGDTLHLTAFDIDKVTVQFLPSKTPETSCCLSNAASKFFTATTMIIPKWLRIKQKLGVMEFEGNPYMEEEGNFLVQVLDQYGKILVHFWIEAFYNTPNKVKNSMEILSKSGLVKDLAVILQKKRKQSKNTRSGFESHEIEMSETKNLLSENQSPMIMSPDKKAIIKGKNEFDNMV